MIPLSEAISKVLAKVEPLEVVSVPPAEACGLVLAEDIVALETVPPFANSAMDGYAVRAVDTIVPISPAVPSTVSDSADSSHTTDTTPNTPALDTDSIDTTPNTLTTDSTAHTITDTHTPPNSSAVPTATPAAPNSNTSDQVGRTAVLKVVGTVAAGSQASEPIQTGQAMRIMTGAPLPEGADAVVMVERTRYIEETEEVEIFASVEEGNHVRNAGEDVRRGETLFLAGTLLTPGHIGVIISVGVGTVRVWRRPMVGVLSTGDELVDEPRRLAPGEIRDSNRPVLLAMLAEIGVTVFDLGIAKDNEAAITRAFEVAVEKCDAIVTSGGVSMGAFDYVKVVLDRMGEMEWMQIAIKPAKPFAFGTIGGVPVFGLPGNPVSSMVSFELLARPAVLKMAAHRDIHKPRLKAVCESNIPAKHDNKIHFLRAVGSADEHGGWRVRLLSGQGSHQLSHMARANALVVVRSREEIAEGDEVEIILL